MRVWRAAVRNTPVRQRHGRPFQVQTARGSAERKRWYHILASSLHDHLPGVSHGNTHLRGARSVWEDTDATRVLPRSRIVQGLSQSAVPFRTAGAITSLFA